MTTAKTRTYRALSKGECPVGHWRMPGEVFETDLPKARWMEDITPPEPVKKASPKTKVE